MCLYIGFIKHEMNDTENYYDIGTNTDSYISATLETYLVMTIGEYHNILQTTLPSSDNRSHHTQCRYNICH